MKVSFDKQTLLSALNPAAGISQTKNTLAAVDGLLFECPPNPRYGDYDTDNPNLCRISAFDLEKGLRATVDCRVLEPGLFIINTVKILQIVRTLPDGEVTLSIDGRGRVEIDGGSSHFEITAQPGDDFPSMPMFIGERQYKIPQNTLRELIARTAFAVGQNDQRAAFNGALFRVRNGWLTVTGCDGNRLATTRFPLGEDAPDADMIIPGRFLTELSKLLRDTDDAVTLILGRKNVIVKLDSLYFFTRMIDTEYTNYEKLLPSSYKTQVYVSRDELLGAMERASVVSEDKLGGSGRAYVKLELAGGEVSVSSVSSGGSVFEKLRATVEGAGLTIGFNCRYLLDALKVCPAECDRLRIRLNKPLMGVVIEPAGGSGFLEAEPDADFGEAAPTLYEQEESVPFLYYVMPINLHNTVTPANAPAGERG